VNVVHRLRQHILRREDQDPFCREIKQGRAISLVVRVVYLSSEAFRNPLDHDGGTIISSLQARTVESKLFLAQLRILRLSIASIGPGRDAFLGLSCV